MCLYYNSYELVKSPMLFLSTYVCCTGFLASSSIFFFFFFFFSSCSSSAFFSFFSSSSSFTFLFFHSCVWTKHLIPASAFSAYSHIRDPARRPPAHERLQLLKSLYSFCMRTFFCSFHWLARTILKPFLN